MLLPHGLLPVDKMWLLDWNVSDRGREREGDREREMKKEG